MNAKKNPLQIRGLKGSLYNFQKEGVWFFLKNKGRGMLCDQMGVGKTVQTLAYLLKKKPTRVLVVCPASVKASWNVEIPKWTNFKYIIINSNTEININTFNKYQLFIINYDILEKFFKYLTTIHFDVLILDEFQYIKSHKAKRTKLIRRISKSIQSVLMLSGTPILNRPIEIFNALNILDKRTWWDWWAFSKRYCGGHQGRWGWDTTGATNMEELKKRIKPYFLRRKKIDILPDLPPKRFLDLPVELSEEYREKYNLAVREFTTYLKEVKQKTDPEIKKTTHAEKLVKLGELRQITTLGKVEFAKETIEYIIENDEKVLVYSSYKEPLYLLKKEFGNKAVILTGETPQEERGEIIQQFQENNKVKIFLGGIKSAGVGITLTAASSVLFLDYAWVPADMEQAMDRVHRPGQKSKKITIFQLYGVNTIDEKMKGILEGKKIIFDKLFEEKTEKAEKAKQINLIKALLKYYDNKPNI